MAKKIKTALPPNLNLGGAYIIEWDAVDPTTGATVTGVIVTDANVTAADLSGGGGTGGFDSGPFMLVPGAGA